jgi:hypothetical protein
MVISNMTGIFPLLVAISLIIFRSSFRSFIVELMNTLNGDLNRLFFGMINFSCLKLVASYNSESIIEQTPPFSAIQRLDLWPPVRLGYQRLHSAS